MLHTCSAHLILRSIRFCKRSWLFFILIVANSMSPDIFSLSKLVNSLKRFCSLIVASCSVPTAFCSSYHKILHSHSIIYEAPIITNITKALTTLFYLTPVIANITHKL